MAEAMTVNNNIVKMFAFMGVIALILSVTGLFSLVSLNIIRRMKEIGVRKVLGASIANIARIINTEFIIIFAISAIAGVAMSYFAVEALMSGIWKYYQPASSSTFAYSVVLMLLISALAIGFKVYAAASMNPVKTLRDE
jgi:ABC-type antimicrobial peptide transport system permease subunit